MQLINRCKQHGKFTIKFRQNANKICLYQPRIEKLYGRNIRTGSTDVNFFIQPTISTIIDWIVNSNRLQKKMRKTIKLKVVLGDSIALPHFSKLLIWRNTTISNSIIYICRSVCICSILQVDSVAEQKLSRSVCAHSVLLSLGSC